MILVWGTGNFDRRKFRSTSGRCEFCNRSGDLVSYDALRCFTVFWVPVLPLGRKQIWDECPSCKMGRMMSLRQWRRAARDTLSAAVEAFEREPGAREPATNLLGHIEQLDAVEALEEIEPTIRERFAGDQEVLARLNHVSDQVLSEERGPRGQRMVLPLLIVPLLLLALAAGIVMQAADAGVSRAYVVNGLDRPYDVLINGESVAVPAGGWRDLSLDFGEVTVEPAPGGLDFEAQTYTLDVSFLSRAFDDTTLIINPDRTALLIRETAYYASSASGGSEGEWDPFFGRMFHAFDDLDYHFREAPEQIKTSSSSREHRRTALLFEKEASVEERLAYVFATAGEEAGWRYADVAFEHFPEDVYLLTLLGATEEPAAFVARLKPKLAQRPVLVECHRFYQEAMKAERSAHDLIGEYRSLLAGEPENRALMYLLGRIVDDVDLAESLQLFHDSIEGPDPCAYGHHALAWAEMCEGRFQEGLVHEREALALMPDSATFLRMEPDFMLATGDIEELADRNDAALAADATDYELVLWQVQLLNRVGRGEEAARLVDRHHTELRGLGHEAEELAWARPFFDAAAAEGRGDREAYLEAVASSDADAGWLRFRGALLADDPTLAARLVAGGDALPDGGDLALAHALAMKQGLDELAQELLNATLMSLDDGSRGARDITSWLRGTDPPALAKIVAPALERGGAPCLLAALASHHEARRDELLDAAARFAYQSGFQRMVIEQLSH